jgi:hypothetical protein
LSASRAEHSEQPNASRANPNGRGARASCSGRTNAKLVKRANASNDVGADDGQRGSACHQHTR